MKLLANMKIRSNVRVACVLLTHEGPTNTSDYMIRLVLTTTIRQLQHYLLRYK